MGYTEKVDFYIIILVYMTKISTNKVKNIKKNI